MLKYKANETLTGDVNGINKIFVADNYIAKVDSIVVDGQALTDLDYTVDRYTLTLTTAPVSSIVFNTFYREELDIVGEGLVEFGDITQEVYEELGRNELSKVYVKSRVEAMINKSLKRITNKTSEKSTIQHYALQGLNGLTITEVDTDGFSGNAIQGVGIEGAMLAGEGVYIPYTDYDGDKFTTQLGVDTLIKVGDKAIIGHRIPYGVQKPSHVYVNDSELTFVDSALFTMQTVGKFTIIRGKDGNQYIFLPYSNVDYTLVVQYVPDRKFLTFENDVVDIPYEYTTLIAYDVVYRLLISREDERAQWYKQLIYGDGTKTGEPGLLKEYRTYIKTQVKKSRGRIGFAPGIQEPAVIFRDRTYQVPPTP